MSSAYFMALVCAFGAALSPESAPEPMDWMTADSPVSPSLRVQVVRTVSVVMVPPDLVSCSASPITSTAEGTIDTLRVASALRMASAASPTWTNSKPPIAAGALPRFGMRSASAMTSASFVCRLRFSVVMPSTPVPTRPNQPSPSPGSPGVPSGWPRRGCVRSPSGGPNASRR